MKKTLIAICAVLVAGCSKPQVTVHANFDHWTRTDGRTQWVLELPPETWRQLSHGEPLDATHQDLSERSRKVVKELIDKNLEHMHLCPENWTMDDQRSFENGYVTFSGICDTAPAHNGSSLDNRPSRVTLETFGCGRRLGLKVSSGLPSAPRWSPQVAGSFWITRRTSIASPRALSASMNVSRSPAQEYWKMVTPLARMGCSHGPSLIARRK